jgi:hypothetical protein
MKVIARVAVVLTLAIVAAPENAWAGKGRGGGHRSGARSGPVHHHRHSHFHGAFFFGTPFWYPRPYYAYSPAPLIYVEQYPGEPTPGTRDVIFCPNRNAYYPDATDCPGGWARVIPPG